MEFLVIGRFARLTGLSVGALRHYDEVDLLRPTLVDPETGYPSYRRDQLETARTGTSPPRTKRWLGRRRLPATR